MGRLSIGIKGQAGRHSVPYALEGVMRRPLGSSSGVERIDCSVNKSIPLDFKTSIDNDAFENRYDQV